MEPCKTQLHISSSFASYVLSPLHVSQRGGCTLVACCRHCCGVTAEYRADLAFMDTLLRNSFCSHDCFGWLEVAEVEALLAACRSIRRYHSFWSEVLAFARTRPHCICGLYIDEVPWAIEEWMDVWRKCAASMYADGVNILLIHGASFLEFHRRPYWITLQTCADCTLCVLVFSKTTFNL